MYLCSYAVNTIVAVVVVFWVIDGSVTVYVDVCVVFVLITGCWSITGTYGFGCIVSVSLNNTIYPLLS